MTLENPSHMQRFPYVSFDPQPPAPTVKKEPSAPAKPIVLTPEQLPLPAPAPVFTEKDVHAARAEGHAKGMREGFAAATAKFDKEASDREEAVKGLLEVIANRVTIAAESHAATLEKQQETAGRIVLAIARKIAGEALKRDPYASVQSLLGECMALVAGEPKIVISASVALAPGLRQRLDLLNARLQGFEGEIVITEDESLFDQDCRVEWKNGYAEQNATRLWASIEGLIHKATLPGKET
jgi:flagellar assembly protein FliH